MAVHTEELGRAGYCTLGATVIVDRGCEWKLWLRDDSTGVVEVEARGFADTVLEGFDSARAWHKRRCESWREES